MGGPHDGEAVITNLCGYNEWAKQSLQVFMCTDFVYDYNISSEDDKKERDQCEKRSISTSIERGVYIAEDIAPQTVVFQIPLTSLYSLATISKEEPSYEIIEVFVNSISTDIEEREEMLLAIILLFEMYVLQSESKWAHHLEILPKEHRNLLYYSSDEVKALDGTNLYYVAHEMQERLHEDYEFIETRVLPELKHILKHILSPSVSATTVFSFANYKWALSIIWSRFVSIEIDQELVSTLPFTIDPTKKHCVKAMVPVFDMLNHDPKAEMTHKYDAASGMFQLTTHQHLAAGTQLHINYGPLSNHALLALYGFMHSHNPHDTVEVHLQMESDNTSFYEEKEEFLRSCKYRFDHTQTSIALRNGEISDALLLITRVQEIESEDLGRGESVCDVAKRVLENGFSYVINKEHEKRVVLRLIYLLECQLQLLQRHEIESKLHLREDICKMIMSTRASDAIIYNDIMDKLVLYLGKVLK
uniref:Uncharacterized protein AlNc14C120G6661 n=1 Tax=Albugo laibachii Nc14 TaxID=890382 RepID=F0WJD4_9STRA|nr:conserved hypothetical protein [Albugo laibachii Nc14]|eukprot:CCA21381.1 conserved hypothetical protein [Albugo laibachii Nc14]